ncbi:MAG: hypothetical protein R2764_13610 [Bacteroidales bacterium]
MMKILTRKPEASMITGMASQGEIFINITATIHSREYRGPSELMIYKTFPGNSGLL